MSKQDLSQKCKVSLTCENQFNPSYSQTKKGEKKQTTFVNRAKKSI